MGGTGGNFMTVLIPILISFTSLVIAALVYWTIRQQTEINKEKLRLDLYNRRFDIYSRAVDFYQVLISDPSESELKDSYIAKQKSFIKSLLESQFLFDPKDGVFKILEEMHDRSFKIKRFRDQGKQLDPETLLSWNEDFMESLKWLNETFAVPGRLVKSMAPYLNFHKITA
jgi:hypothetical protein